MARLHEELLVGPPIRESDCDSLLELSDKMYQCEASFEGCGKSWMLNSQDFLHSLFNRLPYRVKTQFVTATYSEDFASFKDLRLLVERAAAEANSEFGVLLHRSKEVTHSKSKPSRSGNSRLQQVCVAQQATKVKESKGDTTFKTHHPDKTSSVEVPCICCNEFHRIWKCSLFKSKTISDSLVGVLTCFRKNKVTLVADVKAMFHQIKVDPRDQNTLRFLWWNKGDLYKESKVYKMVVHPFGGTSSPSCANFCLSRPLMNLIIYIHL